MTVKRLQRGQNCGLGGFFASESPAFAMLTNWRLPKRRHIVPNVAFYSHIGTAHPLVAYVAPHPPALAVLKWPRKH